MLFAKCAFYYRPRPSARRICRTSLCQKRNRGSSFKPLRLYRKPTGPTREERKLHQDLGGVSLKNIQRKKGMRRMKRGKTKPRRPKLLSSYKIITVVTNRLVPHRLTEDFSRARIFELFPRRTFYIFPFINLLGRNKLYESYIYFMLRDCSIITLQSAWSSNNFVKCFSSQSQAIYKLFQFFFSHLSTRILRYDCSSHQDSSNLISGGTIPNNSYFHVF